MSYSSSSWPIPVIGQFIRLRTFDSRLRGWRFPEHSVELDEHPRTIDMLRARQLDDPVLIVGADELADFPTWKSPDEVLELARLAVATRPGYPMEPSDRVMPFDIEPMPVSSTEVRDRVTRGEPVDDLVPPAVAGEIARLGLYRD